MEKQKAAELKQKNVFQEIAPLVADGIIYENRQTRLLPHLVSVVRRIHGCTWSQRIYIHA